MRFLLLFLKLSLYTALSFWLYQKVQLPLFHAIHINLPSFGTIKLFLPISLLLILSFGVSSLIFSLLFDKESTLFLSLLSIILDICVLFISYKLILSTMLSFPHLSVMHTLLVCLSFIILPNLFKMIKMVITFLE